MRARLGRVMRSLSINGGRCSDERSSCTELICVSFYLRSVFFFLKVETVSE